MATIIQMRHVFDCSALVCGLPPRFVLAKDRLTSNAHFAIRSKTDDVRLRYRNVSTCNLVGGVHTIGCNDDTLARLQRLSRTLDRSRALKCAATR